MIKQLYLVYFSPLFLLFIGRHAQACNLYPALSDSLKTIVSLAIVITLFYFIFLYRKYLLPCKVTNLHANCQILWLTVSTRGKKSCNTQNIQIRISYCWSIILNIYYIIEDNRMYLHIQYVLDVQQTVKQLVEMLLEQGLAFFLYCCTAAHPIILRRHQPLTHR